MYIKKKYIKYLMIKIIFLVLIILIFLLNNSYVDNFSNITIDIHVINLDKDIERWNTIKNEAKKQNLNITRFSAINGNTIDLNKYNHYFSNKNLKKGQKGCSLSHIKLWQQLSNQTNKYILVLEDDAIIPKNFLNELKYYMNQLPNNWDMMICGGNNFKGKKYSKNLIRPIIYSGGNWGTYAYLIKTSTTKKLLKVCKNMNTTIDNFLNYNFYSKYNVYFCVPQLIKHDFDAYSNIEQNIRSKDKNYKNKTKII